MDLEFLFPSPLISPPKMEVFFNSGTQIYFPCFLKKGIKRENRQIICVEMFCKSSGDEGGGCTAKQTQPVQHFVHQLLEKFPLMLLSSLLSSLQTPAFWKYLLWASLYISKDSSIFSDKQKAFCLNLTFLPSSPLWVQRNWMEIYLPTERNYVTPSIL